MNNHILKGSANSLRNGRLHFFYFTMNLENFMPCDQNKWDA